jgi:hypothetical protein
MQGTNDVNVTCMWVALQQLVVTNLFLLLPNCSLKMKLAKALQNCLMELKIVQK